MTLDALRHEVRRLRRDFDVRGVPAAAIRAGLADFYEKDVLPERPLVREKVEMIIEELAMMDAEDDAADRDDMAKAVAGAEG